MNKTKELLSVANIVKCILETDKKARNSDSYLYLKVIEWQCFEYGKDLHSISLESFLLHLADWGFAPFETVRRTRQKVQADCPLLRASPEVEKFRSENEKDFRAYARSETNDNRRKTAVL